MVTSAQTIWTRFYATCKRVGSNPKKVLTALLTRFCDQVEDDLRAECLRRQIKTLHHYNEEVTMPRPKRTNAAPADPKNEAAEAAAAAAPVADPLAGLDAAAAPMADPLAALDGAPVALDGLDSLAEGVTPEAIQSAISAVTGGGSGGGDALVAKAIMDLKAQVEKIQAAQEVLDNRLVALDGLIQKSFTAVAQRLDGLDTETRQGALGVQATLRNLQEWLEGAMGVEEEHVAPAPAVASTPAPSPRGAQILAAVAPGLKAKGNPAYGASPVVWEALASLANTSGCSGVTAHEVEEAFKAAGRVQGGKLAY